MLPIGDIENDIENEKENDGTQEAACRPCRASSDVVTFLSGFISFLCSDADDLSMPFASLN